MTDAVFNPDNLKDAPFDPNTLDNLNKQPGDRETTIQQVATTGEPGDPDKERVILGVVGADTVGPTAGVNAPHLTTGVTDKSTQVAGAVPSMQADPEHDKLLKAVQDSMRGRPESSIGLTDPYWGHVNAYRMYVASKQL